MRREVEAPRDARAAAIRPAVRRASDRRESAHHRILMRKRYSAQDRTNGPSGSRGYKKLTRFDAAELMTATTMSE